MKPEGGIAMPRSMTGFGRGEAHGPAGRIVVEMKSVNHRFSEVVFRMPRQFGANEEPARKVILSKVNRGRVDVGVSWDPPAKAGRIKVDKELAIAYCNSLKELGEEIGSKIELTLDSLAKLPDVFKVEEGEVTAAELWPTFETAVTEAVSNLIAMREREGAALVLDLADRISKVEALCSVVAARAPDVVKEYRTRLERRIEELLPQGHNVDPSRLAQEVALFADRSDITEEVQRLGSHVAQFRQALQADDAVGRKLDFLVQEIGREVNTMGSKANDAAITTQVIEAKCELEKIREQVQNIE
jgi:uncharacterized protein (TIGR00255 family)